MNDFKYWRIERPAKKIFFKFIWMLPDSVVYWCVIRAACKVEPNLYPGNVTALEMMEKLKPSEASV